MSLSVGSLFSGIGGFDLGFEQAGMETRWQVERDPDCRDVLALRFPHATRAIDVNAFAYGRSRNRQRHGLMLPSVDILCGGFPCQDLSVAGKREGLKGARSGLFFAFMRILAVLRPQPSIVVIENVPGLLSSHGGRDFHTVLRTLAERGYRRGYRILDSQFFGVPQRRRRVFIVGCLRASGLNPATILFESPCGDGNSASSCTPRPRVAATLRVRSKRAGVNEPGRGGEDDYNLICFDWQSGGDVRHSYSSMSSSLQSSQTPAIYQCHGTNVGDLGTLRSGNGNVTGGVPFTVDGERARALVASMHKRHDDDSDTLIPTLTQSLGHHGYGSDRGDGASVIPTLSGDGKRRPGQQPDDAESLQVCATLNSGGNNGGFRTEPGAHLHETRAGVRRLTPIECERLQGFPDGWTCRCGNGARGSRFCICPDTPRYKQLGNAVTVTVARWIGERIRLAHER